MQAQENDVWVAVAIEVYVITRVVLLANQYVFLAINVLHVLIKEQVDAAVGAKNKQARAAQRLSHLCTLVEQSYVRSSHRRCHADGSAVAPRRPSQSFIWRPIFNLLTASSRSTLCSRRLGALFVYVQLHRL